MIITDHSPAPAPKRRITEHTIPGRSGALLTDDGGYDNVECSYSVAWWGDDSLKLPDLSLQIRNWLVGKPGYQILYDTYEPDYFRMAYVSNQIDISEMMMQIGKADIKFSCKPFRYSWEGQQIFTLTQPGKIYNPEFCQAEPYLKIYGSGDITLNIENKGWIFKDITDFIEVDSEMMNAYKETLPMNDRMQGEGFPILNPGWNELSWEGNLQKIEWKPRWKSL
jgi:predicted phage tail component-like protein